MYCVNGESRSSLLIVSTDSMIIIINEKIAKRKRINYLVGCNLTHPQKSVKVRSGNRAAHACAIIILPTIKLISLVFALFAFFSAKLKMILKTMQTVIFFLVLVAAVTGTCWDHWKKVG